MRASRLVVIVAVFGLAMLGCGDDDVRLRDSGSDTAAPVPPPERDMGSPDEDMGTPPPRDLGTEDAGDEDAGDEDAAAPDGSPSEPCDRPGSSEDLVCGMCGSQTRFCTSARVWEYGACEGEHGVCIAGDVGEIDCGGRTIDALCNSSCVWFPADRDARCPLPTCDDPVSVTLVDGDTVSVDLDTRHGTAGPLSLGDFCGGNPPAMVRPPQVVVAVDIPGTGTRLVDFTLVNDATDTTWDTIVQVRRECETAPSGFTPMTCFDDDTAGMPMPGGLEPRSAGRFAAMGGTTVYLLVSGFYMLTPLPDRQPTGIGRLDLSLGGTAAAPTITAASISVSPETSTISVTGGDDNGDAASVRIRWLDAAGAPVDVDGDGTVGAPDESIYPLEPRPTGMTTFMSSSSDFFLAMRLEGRRVARASVSILDDTGLESAPLTVDASIVTLATFGEPCDETHVCRMPLVCTSGTCQPSAEATAACAGATSITLTGTPSAGSVTGMLSSPAGMPAPSLFSATCGSTGGGPEALHRVTVPASGTFDLVLSTQNAGTPMGTDTVLYVRGVCGNPTTESACIDDDREVRSRLTIESIAAGEHTIFVERYGGVMPGLSIDYQLDVTLRPVVGGGASCDPMGVSDRCATGTCAAGMCPP